MVPELGGSAVGVGKGKWQGAILKVLRVPLMPYSASKLNACLRYSARDTNSQYSQPRDEGMGLDKRKANIPMSEKKFTGPR